MRENARNSDAAFLCNLPLKEEMEMMMQMMGGMGMGGEGMGGLDEEDSSPR